MVKHSSSKQNKNNRNMILNCEASHHAIPEAYPAPKGTEGLIESIRYNIKEEDSVPTPTQGEDYAHLGLLADIGE